jgi:hypothetical protein
MYIYTYAYIFISVCINTPIFLIYRYYKEKQKIQWMLVRWYIEILERFQSKALHSITNAPWYVPNTIIRRDLQVPSVKEKIRRFSAQY